MTVAVHAFDEGEASGRLLAARLDVPFGLVRTHEFPDGEVLPTVSTPARTVIVYRSLDRPNAKLVELVLAAEAWRRLGAERLVLAAPYLAYMRQDTAFDPGQAISQKAIAGLLGRYFDRLVTVDAHLHRTPDIGALFAPVAAENLTAGAMIGRWLAAEGVSGAVLVGPDVESTPLVRAAADELGAPWLAFNKTRRGDRSVELALDGPNDILGRPVVIIDDICSTGATLAGAVGRAKALGATDIRVVVVHALFDEAVEAKLRAAGARQIVATDSVSHATSVISLAGLLADALRSELNT